MLSQLVINGLIAGSIYALIAIGFAVVYKTVRFFHFAHGAVYTVGAYGAYSVTIQLGAHPIVGFFLPPRWRESSASALTDLSTVPSVGTKPATSCS